MRAGTLRHRGTILSLGHNLEAVTVGSRRMSVVAKDEGDAPAASSLLSPSKITLRTRYAPELIQGRYVRVRERLFRIDSVRDAIGIERDQVATATELVGSVAEYRKDAGAAAVACRVFVIHGAARPAENIGKTEYLTQVEAALIEVGRPQTGAVFDIAGQAWRVTGLVDDEDNRTTRKMWVKPA